MICLLSLLCVALFNSILVTSSIIPNEINATSHNVRYSETHSGDAIHTQDEYNKVKFMVLITVLQGNPPAKVHVGTGIVVSTTWAITMKAAVDGYTAGDLTATVCLGPLQINGLQRRVKRIVNDPDCATSPLVHCVSLLRICPSITAEHIPVIAPSLAAYRSPTKRVRLYEYFINGAGITYIGYYWNNATAVSVCSNIPGFIEVSHVCLVPINDPLGFEPMDLKGLVVTDYETTEVVGFFVKETIPGSEGAADTGEVVLYLEAVRNFINTNIN